MVGGRKRRKELVELVWKSSAVQQKKLRSLFMVKLGGVGKKKQEGRQKVQMEMCVCRYAGLGSVRCAEKLCSAWCVCVCMGGRNAKGRQGGSSLKEGSAFGGSSHAEVKGKNKKGRANGAAAAKEEGAVQWYACEKARRGK